MFKTAAYAAAQPERVNGDLRIIAQWITPEDVRKETSRQGSMNVLGGIFNLRQAVIGPSEVAVILRNGRVEDTVTQDKLTRLGGGLVNWLAEKFAGGQDVEILFVDTSSLEIEMPVGDDAQLHGYAPGTRQSPMRTKDGETVYGVSNLRIQVNPTNATHLLGKMRGTKELTLGGLGQHLASELLSTVYKPQVSQCTRQELQTDEVRGRIESVAITEMRQALGLWGIDLQKLWTVWGKDEFDKTMSYKANLAQWSSRTDAWKDTAQSDKMGDLRRQHETHMRELEDKWTATFTELAGRQKQLESEESMRNTAASGDAQRSGMAANEKLRQAVASDSARLDSKRSEANLEQDIKDRESDRAMSNMERMNQMELGEKKLENEHQQRQMETRTTSRDKIMQQAIDKGIVDGSTLQEMLRQDTMQQAMDRDKEKVASFSAAEKERYNQQTYRAAEDRERQHQKDSVDSSAKLMDSAKQNVPQTYVQGSSGGGVSTPVNVQNGGALCPSCGVPVQATFKYCPGCQAPLGKTP